MRRRGAPLVACLCALASGAWSGPAGAAVMPRAASALRGSVGVNTHSVYYDTAYLDWPRVIAAVKALGVTHLRDGIFASPAPRWQAFEARYEQRIESAAAQGLRFDFVIGEPGQPAAPTGTPDQAAQLAATQLRRATDALEGPNEYDAVGPPGWQLLLRATQAELYTAVRARSELRGVPVLAPSLARHSQQQLGPLAGSLDAGNLHLYTAGESPSPALIAAQLAQESEVSGSKPVWATEAGFDDALNAPPAQSQPPVPDDVAAVYTLRTVLEHFAAGIPRTYLYELLDEKPDPLRIHPEQHFGLLRSNFTPKPAYTALRNLIALLGAPTAPPRLAALDVHVAGPPALRSLFLERRDGTYLVVLWTDAPLWSPVLRERLGAPAVAARVQAPAGAQLSVYDPVRGARGRRVAGRTAELSVGADPDVVEVAPPGAFAKARP